MQQIIVDIVVAAAVLFLLRWLYRGFVTKPREKSPSCGSCPQCESVQTGVERPATSTAVEFKG